MGLADIIYKGSVLYRPGAQEINDAADAILAYIKEGEELRIKQTFLGKWVIPNDELPESLQHLNGKAARSGLDMLLKNNLVSSIDYRELDSYTTYETSTFKIYFLSPAQRENAQQPQRVNP